MKLTTIATVSILSLSLFTSLSYAKEEQQSVGLVTGLSNGEYKNSTQDGDGFAQAYLFYNYKPLDNFSVEVAYNGAVELDNWDCEETSNDNWSCGSTNKPLFGLHANKFELNGVVFALKGQAPISQRNSLYGKLGAQYYDYKFYRNNHFVEGADGTGFFFEAGWQYQWDLGIGMNIGLRYQDLGELTLRSSNVGISYAF